MLSNKVAEGSSRVKGSDKTVITYAFLDNGSSSSFCTVSIEATWSERSEDEDISVYP